MCASIKNTRAGLHTTFSGCGTTARLRLAYTPSNERSSCRGWRTRHPRRAGSPWRPTANAWTHLALAASDVASAHQTCRTSTSCYRRQTINCSREYWTTRSTLCTSYLHLSRQHHRSIASDASVRTPRTGHLTDCNFITKLLYKNSYQLNNIHYVLLTLVFIVESITSMLSLHPL